MTISKKKSAACFLSLYFGLIGATAAGDTTSPPQALTQTESTRQSLQQKAIHQQASEWGLTAEEWQRYEQLKQGRRGIQSPGIDPLTMLGLEARTPQERQRYAEMLVHQEKKRTEAELALQRAYNEAWKRLFPALMPIGTASARLAIFVRVDCGKACSDVIARVINEKKNADFYLVDSRGDDAVVRRWATAQQIPAERVQDGSLTLNHDSGHWLRQGQGRMPAILQQNEGGLWVPATF